MAVILGIFRLLFIDTTIDKAVVVGNLQLVAQSRNAAQRPLEVACCSEPAAVVCLDLPGGHVPAVLNELEHRWL